MRLGLLLLAGCLPSEAIQIEYHSETKTLIHLAMRDCLPTQDPNNAVEGDDCSDVAKPYLKVAEVDEIVPLSLSPSDRLFIGQYRQPVELLGVPAELDELMADCKARSFPPSLLTTQFDIDDGPAPLQVMPVNRKLPEFEYETCRAEGLGCLALEDGVPVCSGECSKAPAMIAEARSSTVVAGIEFPETDECVQPNTRFDFDLRTCVPLRLSCDGDGWPTGASGVFVDAGAAMEGIGTQASPYRTFGPQLRGEPTILIKSSASTLEMTEVIDWDVDIVGCWHPAIAPERSKLGHTTIASATVSMFGVHLADGASVSSSELSLREVTAATEVIDLVDSNATMEDVVLQNMSSTAIRAVRGRLFGLRTYVGAAMGHGIECSGCTLDLTELAMVDVGMHGLYVRDAGALVLVDADLRGVGYSAIQVEGTPQTAATAELTGVRITGFGSMTSSTAAGLLARSTRATAEAIYVSDAENLVLPSGDRPVRSGIIATTSFSSPRSTLQLRSAGFQAVGSGLRVRGSDATIDSVYVADVTDEAIAVTAGSDARITNALVECARIGVSIGAASLTGGRITVVTPPPQLCPTNDSEPTRLEAGLEVSMSPGDELPPRVMLEDIVVADGRTGLVLDVPAIVPDRIASLKRVRLENVGHTSAGGGIELRGGHLELEDVRIQPADSSSGFIFGGPHPLALRSERVIVEAVESRADVSGLEVLGDGKELALRFGEGLVDLEGFEVFLRNPAHVLSMEQCSEPDLPYRLVPGIGVEGLLGSYVGWPDVPQ